MSKTDDEGEITCFDKGIFAVLVNWVCCCVMCSELISSSLFNDYLQDSQKSLSSCQNPFCTVLQLIEEKKKHVNIACPTSIRMLSL